ncbi:MAG TPA: HD family phosphohydrolase [Lachnospiraceae bacterium]|nr:HD family phosphohydrolase [Lachnospiraceae bacterium]
MQKQKNLSKDKNFDSGFYEVVKDILHDPEVLKMKNFNQHSNTDCYMHCLHVSYYNYRICRALRLNAGAAARAGMLHDFFLYDWRHHPKAPGERMHAFTHAGYALRNAEKTFELSEREEDIILRHMWPVTITPPKHMESWIITLTDKYCSICEFIDHYYPLKGLHAKFSGYLN